MTKLENELKEVLLDYAKEAWDEARNSKELFKEKIIEIAYALLDKGELDDLFYYYALDSVSWDDIVNAIIAEEHIAKEDKTNDIEAKARDYAFKFKDLTDLERQLLIHLLMREDMILKMWTKSIIEAGHYNKENDIETITMYFRDFISKYIFDYMRKHTQGIEATEIIEHALLGVRFWKLCDILINKFNLTKGGEDK